MKRVPVEMTTVDMETGEVVKQETVEFGLLPPDDPECCQVCNHRHEPELPHNIDSLYYQYAFYAQHNRWPTLEDSMEHCTDEMKAAWAEARAEVIRKRDAQV